jgi:hypothetical protein
LEGLSQFHNLAAFLTDGNVLRRSGFYPDRLLANDNLAGGGRDDVIHAHVHHGLRVMIEVSFNTHLSGQFSSLI